MEGWLLKHVKVNRGRAFGAKAGAAGRGGCVDLGYVWGRSRARVR